MKKIFILTLSLLILTSCSKSSTQIKVNESTKNTTYSYENILEKINTDYKQDTNLNTCLTRNINSCFNSAVNEKAQDKSDYKICEDLSDNAVIETCKEAVILNKAKKEENEKLCDVLEKNKDMCYYQVLSFLATEKLDTKYCDLLIESNTWSWTAVTNDKNMCINSVLMQTAIKKKNISYCKMLKEKSMQETCKNNVNPSNIMPSLPSMPPIPPINPTNTLIPIK